MITFEIFKNEWSFDPRLAVITIIIIPVIYVLLRMLSHEIRLLAKYGFNGVLYWFNRSVRRSMAAYLSLQRYCTIQLNGSNQHLYVPSNKEISLETDRVFVPLTLEHAGTKSGSYTQDSLLTIGDRIKVVGDPGSGKSSLVKKLFRDKCREVISEPRSSQFPILWELKNLNVPENVKSKELGNWLLSELRSYAGRVDAYEIEACFDVYSKTTGLLILLDGLDEIQSTMYPRAEEAILGLSRRLGEIGANNTLVVTLRTQFNQQIKDSYFNDFPNTVAINPFTPTDVYEFLTKLDFVH